MRALVADDYPGVSEANAQTLRGMGFIVNEVKSGNDANLMIGAAIDACAPFDLLVLDHQMEPGPAGFEILQTLRRCRNLTPVVLATGSDPLEFQNWPTHAVLLQKPYTPLLLEEAVRCLVPSLDEA